MKATRRRNGRRAGASDAPVREASESDGRVLAAGGFIVLTALAAYGNSFSGPFVFDDQLNILDNPTIRSLWPLWGPLRAPGGIGLTVEGRPLLNFSLALNYALSGTAVWSYHAANLVLHTLAGLCLFGIARRTLRRPILRDRFGETATGLAAAIAVLWTVHPLQTESVTYIIQRAESLGGLFYLLTLYGFIRAAEGHAPGRRWFVFSLVACLAGMASKETMVSAPLAVLLYDRTFVAGTFREALRRRWRYYAALAATWLLLTYLVSGAHGRGGTAGFGTDVPWWAYALTQCRAVVLYLKLSVWPHPLVFDYGTDVVLRSKDVALQGLILLSLAVATLDALRSRPVLGFLGFWFFAILAPTSSVVPVATQTIAEHRMYLPLAAVIALLTATLHRYLPRWGMPGFAVAAVACVALTAARNRDYRSEVDIWRDTAEKLPSNGRAHNALGVALGNLGRFDEALEHLKAAVDIEPDSAAARNNLANRMYLMGRYHEALAYCGQALLLAPDLAEAYDTKGVILAAMKQWPEAIACYDKALTLKPDLAETHNNLGLALVATGRARDAIGHYEEAIRLRPDQAEAYYNLGEAFLKTGQAEKARTAFEKALRLKPDHANARDGLARAEAERK